MERVVPNVWTAIRIAGAVMLLGVVCAFAVFAVPQTVGADHSYVLLSSSMSPTMHAGDAVIVEEVSPRRIERGDVITFTTPTRQSTARTTRVTHRVVKVVERGDERQFRTKGDANDEPDPDLVPAESVVGQVMFSIPLIGHVILFDVGSQNLVVLGMFVSVLFVMNEVWSYAAGGPTEVDSTGNMEAEEDP